MSKRIIVVEDEPGLLMSLNDRLTTHGYVVETAEDGETGLELAANAPFDLIILDVMLPRMDGFDVCRNLRRQSIQTPIIMLTARNQITDKVTGLKNGADDYLPKPFEMEELLARVEALLRRVRVSSSPDETVYQCGLLRVDFRRAEVEREGESVTLAPREFKLLCYFIKNRGLTLSRDELLDGVWGQDAVPTNRTVDVHVAWLRQKLEENPSSPQLILTVHGLGYKFVG